MHPTNLTLPFPPPQLALFPGFWHLVLAYVFFCFLVRGRSPAVLERQVRGRIWWTVVLFLLSTTAIQATVFYARGGNVGPGHVRVVAAFCACVFCLLFLSVARRTCS